MPGFRSSQIGSHDSVRIGSHKEQLLSRSANIVIQKRSIDANIQDCLQSLQRLPPFRQQVGTSELLSFRGMGQSHIFDLVAHDHVCLQVSLVVSENQLEEELGLLLNALEPSELQQWLLQDIQALALDFCSILGVLLPLCDIKQS